MSVRSSIFDTLEDVYSFGDAPNNVIESRPDSPILGFDASEGESVTQNSFQSSNALTAVPMSPLPPFCAPTRRYSRQTSVSSTASIRNALYLDPELEQGLHASLRTSTSLRSMQLPQPAAGTRMRATTLSHSPSASVDSAKSLSEAVPHEDDQHATTPTAPCILPARRPLPFGPLNTTSQNAVASSSLSNSRSAGQLVPNAVPYNPDLPNPLEHRIAFPATIKRYSFDEQSDLQSNMSSPPFSRFPSSLGSSSRVTSPNTSPVSSWSRAEGKRALDTIAQAQEEEGAWERSKPRVESSRWSIASSEHDLPNRPPHRFFGHSIEGLSGFASRSSKDVVDPYESTLRTLEGQTSPRAGTWDNVPKTPKKRQRLRSFISRLSHLPSPNIAQAPPTPSKLSGTYLAPPESKFPKRSSFSSLVDKDPFRAEELSIIAPALPPAVPPKDTLMEPPSQPRRTGNRKKMKSFFFHHS